VLINTPAVANLIRQGKIDQLESTMQAGAAAGMRTMDSAIELLLEQGVISGRSAYEKSINKQKFEQLREQD
jgi:twitching motility protein PilT